VLFASKFPDQQAQLRDLVSKHIDEVVDKEWPAMAEQKLRSPIFP
jgi:hypothetical protein